MSGILQIVIGGLLQGGVFAIVALGFSLVYRVTNVVNLSQGAFCVLGAMGMYYFQVVFGWPVLPAAVAAVMLRLLSGRIHCVVTGVAVVTAAGAQVAAETTAVRFLALSDAEIAEYVATGEPLDKAGAYAIQGRAARWIPRIEGCYFNVVGLPIALVSSLLESCGYAD